MSVPEMGDAIKQRENCSRRKKGKGLNAICGRTSDIARSDANTITAEEKYRVFLKASEFFGYI